MAKTHEEKFTPKPTQLKYRYYCEACTGRAFYAAEKNEFNQVQCQNCGTIVGYNPNNWFEVTDKDELAKINS